MPIYYYDTVVGEIGIAEKDGKITHLHFANEPLPQVLNICETPILKEAARQLKVYLSGEIKDFFCPLHLKVRLL
ncbi:MAG: hypothetical protein APF76_11355 [Desulfitibacter sp. BRH_c19]|nr:MAG: hypothetical protein APF76_11355 [Desulfitibacter sp. BRH_c19]